MTRDDRQIEDMSKWQSKTGAASFKNFAGN
jgi:hypothetical protein